MGTRAMPGDYGRTIPGEVEVTPVVARAPRQTRGQERVDVILDTTAQVIAEGGVASVTMHGIARLARTSIGSMYYFFPSRDSLLNALVDRHNAAMREIGRGLTSIPADLWEGLPTEMAAVRLVTPYVKYLQNHMDYIPLMHGRSLSKEDADFIHTIRHVLDARLRVLTADERQAYATMLYSIAAGIIHMAFQITPDGVRFYLHEIPKVVAAYLTGIEAKIAEA